MMQEPYLWTIEYLCKLRHGEGTLINNVLTFMVGNYKGVS